MNQKFVALGIGSGETKTVVLFPQASFNTVVHSSKCSLGSQLFIQAHVFMIVLNFILL